MAASIYNIVNKWLERMKADNFRGAQNVFAWTFHSQGRWDIRGGMGK